MRILWFTNTSSNYLSDAVGYNGGGWISSLENEIKRKPEIELALAFNFNKKVERICHKNDVTYYPIFYSHSMRDSMRRMVSYSMYERKQIGVYLKIISEYKPDIIHIFGTEQNFGLISQYIRNIPIILHIQGLINPCLNAFIPPGYTLRDYYLQNGMNLKKIVNNYIGYKRLIYAAKREKNIFKSCKYYFGRTEWDKAVLSIYAPHAQYFHCSEILRESFWQSHSKQTSDVFTIISTISTPLYKGADLILKTAQLLKETLNLKFQWIVYGISDFTFVEKNTHIKCTEVNVNIKGVANATQLRDALLSCNVFVHPSYIDNSPNSVCEAQILGVPVIACHVGGVSSLIEHNETGILTPSNEPHWLATYVKKVMDDSNWAKFLGDNARVVALKRHDKNRIIKDLLDTYHQIVLQK